MHDFSKGTLNDSRESLLFKLFHFSYNLFVLMF